MWPGARMKINTALPAFFSPPPPSSGRTCVLAPKVLAANGVMQTGSTYFSEPAICHGGHTAKFKTKPQIFLFFFFFTFFSPFSLFFNPSRGRSSFSPQYYLSPAINGALWQGIYWKQNSQALQWELCARQILHNLFARRQLAALPPRQPHSRLGLRPAETGP